MVNRAESPADTAGDVPGQGERAALDALRRRMLLLARLLPFEHLHLLDADLDDLESEVFATPLLDGLSDSVDLVASEVEPALCAAWNRAGGA